MLWEYFLSMKLARVTCPGCRTFYESSVSGNDFVVQCPSCGQHNNVPLQSQRITGLCLECGLPLDDHDFAGDRIKPCSGRQRAA